MKIMEKPMLATLLTVILFASQTRARFLSITGTDTGGVWTLTLDFIRETADTADLAFVAIWTQLDNSYPANCRTDGGTGITLTSPVAGTQRTILQIDVSTPGTPVFKDANGVDIGCSFMYDDGTMVVDFIVRTFVTAVSGVGAPSPVDDDLEFRVSIDGTGGVTDQTVLPLRTLFGDGWTDSVVMNTVTEDTVTLVLEVVDQATKSVQTNMELGKAAQLKFTLTTDPYKSDTSIAGARMKTCEVSSESDFSAPSVTFIDTDGCFLPFDADTQYMFYNARTNKGFDYSSSTLTDTTWTFIAYSDPFEMAGFPQIDVSSGSTSSLYFRCELDPCYDVSDTASGECGGNHCDGTRRKRRSERRPGAIVYANVTVIHSANNTELNRQTPNQKRSCDNCVENSLGTGTMATLWSLSAVVFAAMVYVYMDVSSTFVRLRREGAGHVTPYQKKLVVRG
ncbi:uncharacterized protein LOC128232593 [Mya arenaria]|uniref:uncharacterized protein LOC128232593 n=1 Tax=Mya arenaria TaxID=6604 RepID=UPI0022E83A51|nr:uncharacterized protein LOC128232593 [Mya arenaria]